MSLQSAQKRIEQLIKDAQRRKERNIPHKNNNLNYNINIRQKQTIMNNPQQPTMSTNNTSFYLIWYYWYKKYMNRKNKKSNSLPQLSELRHKYRIQCIETQGMQNATILKKRIQEIKQKNRAYTGYNLQSNNSVASTNTNSLTSPPLFYTINPELQSKDIQEIILAQAQQSLDKQQSKQLINELHSYYLNSKTIFIIYKHQKDHSLSISRQQTLSKPSYGYEGSLLASRVNLSSFIQDDSLGMDRNDSILQSLDKMQDKIQNLQLLDKFVELDGFQIWNAKYYSMPHSFVKIKKNCWAKTLSDPNPLINQMSIIHPCQPKTVGSLPIIPRIRKYKPSIDKLKPFVAFMEQLWQKYPNLSPTCESIFQYNGLPYIFIQDLKQQSIAVLCFYIVYGNQEGSLSQKMVERWMESNPNHILAKTIRYMKDRVRNKNSSQYKQIVIKGFFDHNDVIW